MSYAEAQERIKKCRGNNSTSLDLVGLDLEELPPELFELEQLTELLLGERHGDKGNCLRTLPKSIGYLIQLQELYIANNQLSVLPEALSRLENLHILSLANNQLSALPESITRLKNLRILYLDNNRLSTLPESIGRLVQLQELHITNNQLSMLPESIGQLIQLQELSLANNRLNLLPESISQLKNLRRLPLANNHLSLLPEPISRLAQLQDLSFDNNQLSTLPEPITLLENLQRLSLANNQLSLLPESISRLAKLQYLSLVNNQLSTLPESISRLAKLQYLSLDNNQLCLFPEALSNLTQLQELYLDNNQLSMLPESISFLKNLRRLSLANNQLSLLPESISSLAKLQFLSLDSNRLSTLPESITRLAQLQFLYLANNQFFTLPEPITRIANLLRLSLANNQLSLLPESITRLTNLRRLHLDSNQLSALPESITRLAQLQFLSLANNPLLYPPEPIAARGVEAVRTYLEKFGEPDHLYEAKLLLVGEGRVGKTSLAKTLASPGYHLADESSTEGIAIRTWTIPKEELGTEKDFRLNVWDFGGQEIYHATHQFFLTRRSLYLLVTESRKEDKHEDFYYWLNIIRLLGDRSPVLLVLNKCDQPTKELPFNEYRQRFSALSDYLKVSCAFGYEAKIEDLRQTIYRVLRDPKLMAHIGAPLPKVWVTVREAIEQLRLAGRNHISRDEYTAICTQHEVDEVTAGVLGDYFHDLGIFLYFRDDIELEETIFLNYAWVTDAVYKVLDNEVVKKQYGQFSTANLHQVWSEEKYRSKRRELLALMKNRKFELCYELPSGDYLAPQLLPIDELEYEWRTSVDNFHFEYRYEFMPKGILSRFIVKRHPDIYKQTHWRYGVLLEWSNTRALVRERYFDRKITVLLEGRNKRDFLQIIRKSIEEIHNTFNNLDVTEMVPCNCTACQSAETPHFYPHELLTRYQREGIRVIRCDKSLKEVDVQRLINDVFPPPSREEDELGRRITYNIGTQINSNGGTVVAGNVDAEGDFIGHDQTVEGDQHRGNTTYTEEQSMSKRNQTNNAWINGSFYLVALAVILSLIAYISNQVSWYVFPVVLVGGLLAVGIIGAFQLRNDGQLSEKNFLELILETYKRLPLLRRQK